MYIVVILYCLLNTDKKCLYMFCRNPGIQRIDCTCLQISISWSPPLKTPLGFIDPPAIAKQGFETKLEMLCHLSHHSHAVKAAISVTLHVFLKKCLLFHRLGRTPGLGPVSMNTSLQSSLDREPPTQEMNDFLICLPLTCKTCLTHLCPY